MQQPTGCMLAGILAILTSIAIGCGRSADRPTTFDPRGGSALVSFGEPTADGVRGPLFHLCLVSLFDAEGSKIMDPAGGPDWTYGNCDPIEVNPGRYSFRVTHGISSPDIRRAHFTLTFDIQAGHAYRILVVDVINVLEAIQLTVAAMDETIGTEVARDEQVESRGIGHRGRADHVELPNSEF